jgi:hypothetical protein
MSLFVFLGQITNIILIILTIAIGMENDSFNINVKLRAVVFEHVVFANSNLPSGRIVGKKFGPNRPEATSEKEGSTRQRYIK